MLRHLIRVVLLGSLGSLTATAWAQSASDAERVKEAAALVRLIESAERTMKSDCGPVSLDGSAEVNCSSGRMNIGEAWNVHLVAAGFPRTMAEREELAKRLGLDTRYSLLLALPVTDPDRRSLLMQELKRLAAER